MNSESQLVVELWDYLRDNLPASKRQDVANHMLRLFQEYGVELDTDELEGECEILDEAILSLEGGEAEDEDQDSTWGNGDY